MKNSVKFILMAVIAVFTILTGESQSGEMLMSVGFSTLAIAPIAGLSIRDMEQYAQQNFSSFEGDEYSVFEGDDMYIGYNDDFVDFGGTYRSFANEADSNRIFMFTVVNADDVASHQIYLFGGLDTSLDGIVTDGAFKSVAGVADKLSAYGQPKSIKMFKEFLRLNPTACPLIQVETSSDGNQIRQQIIVTHDNPFKGSEEVILSPGVFKNRRDFNDKIMEFDTKNTILSSQTKILTTILPGQTVTYTFFCGAILNTANTLQTKREKAAKTITLAGVHNVQAAQNMIAAGKQSVLGLKR